MSELHHYRVTRDGQGIRVGFDIDETWFPTKFMDKRVDRAARGSRGGGGIAMTSATIEEGQHWVRKSDGLEVVVGHVGGGTYVWVDLHAKGRTWPISEDSLRKLYVPSLG